MGDENNVLDSLQGFISSLTQDYIDVTTAAPSGRPSNSPPNISPVGPTPFGEFPQAQSKPGQGKTVSSSLQTLAAQFGLTSGAVVVILAGIVALVLLRR